MDGINLKMLFIFLAVVFFGLSTLAVPSLKRFGWLPAGLVCLTLYLWP